MGGTTPASRLAWCGVWIATHPRFFGGYFPLEVVKLPEAKKGLVLLPKRWVVECSKAWAARCRRLARADEQLAETRAGWHFVACAILMLSVWWNSLFQVHNTL